MTYENSRVSTVVILILLGPVVTSSTGGNLMLIGGALDEENAEVLDKFVELSGGSGVAEIACITTASEDPEGSGEYYKDLFLRYGAKTATWIPVTETSNNANSNEVVELLQNMTGFFFGGGDQARIVTGWLENDGSDSRGLSVIREKFSGGAIVGGTSAGSACQTVGPMVVGGTSWNGLKDGAVEGVYNYSFPDELIYHPHGIGFLPEYLIDSHFSQRGREGRLIELLLDTGVIYGLGIDENTAALVLPNGEAEIIGHNGGVVFINATSATRNSQAPTEVTNVEVSYFTNEDIFNLYTGELILPAMKTDISGNEVLAEIQGSANIFSSPKAQPVAENVFRDTAQKFWNSREINVTSTTYEKNPEFLVTMRKDGGSGYSGTIPMTFHKMKVDIEFQ